MRTIRNPNAYGGISRLPGNRRRPWRVRVTDHWETDADGKRKQIYKTVGYYETRESAMEALAEYHKYLLMGETNLSFGEVFTRWSDEKFPHIGASQIKNYRLAYNICEPLHKLRFSEIKLVHLQSVIDSSGKNYPMLEVVCTLYSQLYAYAIKHDICIRDYSDFVDISKYRSERPSEIHRIFTSEEIELLWSHADESLDIRIILILICSGVRISELLMLRKEDVNLDERYFTIRQAKTNAGIRIVPIVEAVVPFWQELMELSSSYAVPNLRFPDSPLSYNPYLRHHYTPVLDAVGCTGHLPHDTRYTFVSILTAAQVQPVIIKRIVGHKSKDITERVYTHFEIHQLVDAANIPDYKHPFLESKIIL